MAVANLDVMRVTIQISRKDVDSMQRDMSAGISAETLPGQVFEGRVVETHSESEAGDLNSEAEIHVANAKHILQPGMRVRVSLSQEKRNVLLIPRQAVTEIDGKSHVDVVMDGRVQRRTITVGRNQETTVEVVSGVREGDWVVVHSQRPLKTNSRVRMASARADSDR